MTAGSVTISVPTGTADGDLMLAFITSSDTGAAPGTGWTSVGTTNPRAGEDFAVFRRIASSEPASYTWSWGAGGGEGAILTYRGVDTTTPIDVAFAAGTAETSGSTVTAPTVTTVTNNAMLICSYTNRANQTFSQPTGMTERLDQYGSPYALAVDEELRATAGATGTRASTTSGTISFARAVSFGIRPAATGSKNMLLMGVG